MDNLINNYKQNPTEKNFNLIFNKYKFLIRRVVSPRYFIECHIEDVICDIYMKLPNIIEKFDVNKNVAFSTYLVHSIFNYHERYKFVYITQHSATVSVIYPVQNTQDDNDWILNNYIDVLHYQNETKYDKIEDDMTLNVTTSIEQAVETLTPKEQMIVEMLYVDCLSQSDIADKLNLTVNSLKSTIITIHRKLRPKLLHNKIICQKYCD